MSMNCVNIGSTRRRSACGFLVTAMLVWSIHCGKAEIIPSIFWTPHNPIFLTTNNELKVFPYTRLHIICPNTWTILKRWKGQVPETDLYENIWRVDESGYKTCSTGTATSQPAQLMLCDSPTKVKYDTFVFQSPADSSTTFPPGEEYFFIATSNGKRSSLNSTSGGHCATHNMRFKVYVCNNKEDIRCSTAQKPNPAQVPKESETISPQISYVVCNGTDIISKFCNNTVCGTKTETLQKTKTFVCTIAILASVAVLSMALNAFLLWQKYK